MNKKVEMLVSVIIAAVVMFVLIMLRPISFLGGWDNVILVVIAFVLLVWKIYSGEKNNREK